MEMDLHMHSPESEQRARSEQEFADFFARYQPTLCEVDAYLEATMDKMPEAYAQAYKPWHTALQDLLQGVFLTVKKIPLPDTEAFIDAIKLFSFDSAIQFLYDLCLCCRMVLARDWMSEFRRNIDRLLTAAALLYNQQQQAPGR